MSLLVLLAASDTTLPAAPVLALMGFGVLVAVGGHLYGSRLTVATGITIIFLATAGMVVGGFVAFENEETDPREQRNPREPGF